MNLYLRYFDSEILVTNVDDAIAFLDSIPEITMTSRIAEDVRQYFESDNRFPKRYKVRPKIYFIMIKTDASTMKEFKEYRANSISKANIEENVPAGNGVAPYRDDTQYVPHARMQQNIVMALHTERFGWYEGVFDFKRVVVVPATGKNEYRDTRFVAQCKAMSGIDCYNRIKEHLQMRVDSRSQFPSPKGKNFSFTFLGECKPLPEQE